MLYEVITLITTFMVRSRVLPGGHSMRAFRTVITSYSIHYTKLYESATTFELWVKYAATVLEYKSSLTGWKYYAKGWVNRAIGNLRRGVEML